MNVPILTDISAAICSIHGAQRDNVVIPGYQDEDKLVLGIK